MTRLSIVLPCYNEAETLPSLFARFAEALGDRTDLEVIFVNNGSTDDSVAVFAREIAKPGRAFARVVNVEKNQGYGFGIVAGLRAARGEFIGWTHADSQYDPKIVIEGFARLLEAPEPTRSFLQGQRVQRPLFDAFFTTGMSVVASLMLGTRVDDANAQPKLFPRALFAQMTQPPHDFSLDLYALFIARRCGYALVRLPVVFGARHFGEAKGGGSFKLKWKLTKRTWTFIRQLRRDIRSGRI
jgi:glycosyltransferase involved in cell wall biosynthesis